MLSRCVLLSADGMDDIKYNFLIGQDGVIYEGRGWGVVGQHTDGDNFMSVGQSLTCSFFYRRSKFSQSHFVRRHNSSFPFLLT